MAFYFLVCDNLWSQSSCICAFASAVRHTFFYCSWSEKILLYVKRVVEPEGGHILVALWLRNNILHCNFLLQGMQQYRGSRLSPKICQMGSSMKMGAPNVAFYEGIC